MDKHARSRHGPSSTVAPSSSSGASICRRLRCWWGLLPLLAGAAAVLRVGIHVLRCAGPFDSSPGARDLEHDDAGLRVGAFVGHQRLRDRESCSVRLALTSAATATAASRFATLLAALAPPFLAPEFRGPHRRFCALVENPRERSWELCLPMRTRTDLPYCGAADRLDLLVPTGSAPRETLCRASVLHLLLRDAYDELRAHGLRPALLFGSLLGAVRGRHVIPFTEDADLGFQPLPWAMDVNATATGTTQHTIDDDDNYDDEEAAPPPPPATNNPEALDGALEAVRVALWARGYHLFQQSVPRICVAPTHPLAGNLYDPGARAEDAPYVDLYAMRRSRRFGDWAIDKIRSGRRLPDDHVEPYAQVELNGEALDTLAAPIDFLEHEYGRDWRVPRPRTPALSTSASVSAGKSHKKADATADDDLENGRAWPEIVAPAAGDVADDRPDQFIHHD